jgi:hypothetical protein
MTCASQSRSFPFSLPLFSYILSLTPLVSRPWTKSNHSYSFPITGTPEVAATIHNLDVADRQRACAVYDPALLLVKEGIESNLEVFFPFLHLFYSLTYSLLRRIAVHAISADGPSRACPISVKPFSLSFLLFSRSFSLVLG